MATTDEVFKHYQEGVTHERKRCLKAAKHLPDGWEVRICIEKYAGTVELVDPDGNVTNIEGGNDSGIVGEVNDAICIANGFSI